MPKLTHSYFTSALLCRLYRREDRRGDTYPLVLTPTPPVIYFILCRPGAHQAELDTVATITHSYFTSALYCVAQAHIKPNTKLIFSESPANPTLTLTDIVAVSKLAKSHGILHVCDSTFATPVRASVGRPYLPAHTVGIPGAPTSDDPEVNDSLLYFPFLYFTSPQVIQK